MTQPTGGVAPILEGKTGLRSSIELFTLKDRVCVITGAERGLGLEMALAYAEAGAIVYCLDLPPAPSEEFKRIQQYVSAQSPTVVGKEQGGQTLAKGRIEYATCDVTKQDAVWALVNKIADKEGRLDICVACAGILRSAEVLEYKAADFQKIMDVNVNGVLFTAQAAGQAMVKHNSRGSIIIIASMSGSITNKGMHWTAYNTSKAAVIQMARSLACELGPKGIRCNSISPGYVYTEMTKAFLHGNPQLEKEWCSQNPLGRLANPQELQGIALFLGSDASTFCTGSNLIVDGGQTAW
ncbi:NAD(P)-binding protein [Pholiota conissans]|uniref:NAD(P)-binding protein n=1 Tax=Pholiota conissans TaxID=109636 RepID=A0A9P5Z173_9AGAR|nr:NAD(P)-binding protein [Pholiota conissans]